MERRSNDERGDGEDEGEEDENDVLSEPRDEGVRKEGHLVFDEEDVGGEKPHAGPGRQLPGSQKV